MVQDLESKVEKELNRTKELVWIQSKHWMEKEQGHKSHLDQLQVITKKVAQLKHKNATLEKVNEAFCYKNLTSYKQITNFQTIPIAQKMTSSNWKQVATQNAMKVILYDNLVDHQKMEVKEMFEGTWKKMEEWCYEEHSNMKNQVNRLDECVQMLEG